MKSTKVNVDRPEISSAEIAAMRNFNAVLTAFEAVKIPFYRTWWFAGSTALVIVGSIGTAFYLNSQGNSELSGSYEARTALPEFNNTDSEQLLIASAETFDTAYETETNPKPEGSTTEKTIAKKQSEPESTILTAPDKTPETDPLEANTRETAPPHKTSFNQADHWPRIANVFNGNISAKTLCTSAGIETVYPYKINSFSFVCSYLKDGHISTQGARLTNEMCEVIKILPRGTTIHFQDIIASTQDGKELKLNSLRYIID